MPLRTVSWTLRRSCQSSFHKRIEKHRTLLYPENHKATQQVTQGLSEEVLAQKTLAGMNSTRLYSCLLIFFQIFTKEFLIQNFNKIPFLSVLANLITSNIFLICKMGMADRTGDDVKVYFCWAWTMLVVTTPAGRWWHSL